MSINRWMDKEAVVHIHNGILLSYKKEYIWVCSNEMDEPRTYYTKWRKSETERQIPYINKYIGEGNGNPLQYSCLENPVDRGAWWAAIYGVAQSRPRLKRLSMHSCIGEGNGNPLQYSCLEKPMDRVVCQATVHGVARVRHDLATKPPSVTRELAFLHCS